MSFLLFTIILWGSREGIISLILLINWHQRFDLPKVTQLDIGGPRTSSMLTPGTAFSPILYGKGGAKERHWREPQETRVFHYTVTSFWLAELEWLCLVFSQGLSASQNPCQEHPAFFQSRRNAEGKIVLSYKKITEYVNILELKASNAYPWPVGAMLSTLNEMVTIILREKKEL